LDNRDFDGCHWLYGYRYGYADRTTETGGAIGLGVSGDGRYKLRDYQTSGQLDYGNSHGFDRSHSIAFRSEMGWDPMMSLPEKNPK
jgi:hypothetical protein